MRWQWSFDSVPAGSNSFLSNQNGPGSGFTIDRPGTTSTWVVRLTVQDSISGASSSATASFSASACGTAAIAAYAGVFLGPTAVSGSLANATATTHATSPAAPDVTYNSAVATLPISLELFAGDPTAVSATTNKQSGGSPNAVCGGYLGYTWIPYQVPPGSSLSNFGGFGPGNAAQPGAKLDVKGDYVFELFESDQIGGSPNGGGGGNSLPAKQAATFLFIRVQ